MKETQGRAEVAPLTIIAHWAPIVRRAGGTMSWTSPATIAQAPHTRRTAAMPDADATPTPAAVIRLTAMLTYSSAGEPDVRDERASTTAAPTSNSGYSTSRTAASGPICLVVVNTMR